MAEKSQNVPSTHCESWCKGLQPRPGSQTFDPSREKRIPARSTRMIPLPARLAFPGSGTQNAIDTGQSGTADKRPACIHCTGAPSCGNKAQRPVSQLRPDLHATARPLRRDSPSWDAAGKLRHRKTILDGSSWDAHASCSAKRSRHTGMPSGHAPRILSAGHSLHGRRALEENTFLLGTAISPGKAFRIRRAKLLNPKGCTALATKRRTSPPGNPRGMRMPRLPLQSRKRQMNCGGLRLAHTLALFPNSRPGGGTAHRLERNYPSAPLHPCPPWQQFAPMDTGSENICTHASGRLPCGIPRRQLASTGR